MKVDKNTKITDILKEYPWLKEELPKIDDRLKILNNPMAKVMIGKKTVADVSEKAGISVDEILDKLDEVLDYKKRGFTAVKIKVGHPDGIERDIERLKLCREHLGSSVKIMMDANQGLDVVDALKLAEMAKAIGLQWFEEPVKRTDYAAYQLLREKCGITLAMGEREYDKESLKNLIARNAIDLWQPDIVRLGGVEEWRNSAALADAYHIPVLPHYYKDYDVPLLCTVPGAYGAESFDWIDGIIDNTMRIEDGFAYPREGAGWGFVFKEEYLDPVE